MIEALLGAAFGALFAAPAGYYFQRFRERPRLKVTAERIAEAEVDNGAVPIPPIPPTLIAEVVHAGKGTIRIDAIQLDFGAKAEPKFFRGDELHTKEPHEPAESVKFPILLDGDTKSALRFIADLTELEAQLKAQGKTDKVWATLVVTDQVSGDPYPSKPFCLLSNKHGGGRL